MGTGDGWRWDMFHVHLYVNVGLEEKDSSVVVDPALWLYED